MQTYSDLIVWRKAIDLVEEVYKATKEWPREKIYGLTSQIRRAVVAVPANIAEGQGRGSARDFHRFLTIANGSLIEPTHRAPPRLHPSRSPDSPARTNGRD